MRALHASLIALPLLVLVPAAPAAAADSTTSHALSLFGDVKYPPDFSHFDYVDPNAPKGGTFSQVGATRAFNQNFLTFNSLNIFILRGDGAQGMALHDPLAVGLAVDPSLGQWVAVRLAIGSDGETLRTSGAPKCRVAKIVESDRFIRLFLDRLCPATAPPDASS